jgi:exopolyphosphatase/guanosine-5'-triphosphate,3'-diphosphate pyrophosphatase
MARERRRTILAAVDIGSYSVHLLVARVAGRRAEPIHDESAFLGLGRTIDRDGRLGEARAELTATLASYKIAALSRDASAITVVATDPLRRASDAAEAVTAIEAATGIRVVTISHEEEASIALLGVTGGRSVARTTVLVDVGGGSTEVLVAAPGGESVAVGLPLGATRLTGVHVRCDPPGIAELEAMAADAERAMAFAPDAHPAVLVAVGGTARSLLRVGPPLRNRLLTRRRLRASLQLIAGMSAASLAARYSVRPSRAAVLPAGAVILESALKRYGLDHLRVARGGLREGLILATAEAGEGWRAGLPAIGGRADRTASGRSRSSRAGART